MAEGEGEVGKGKKGKEKCNKFPPVQKSTNGRLTLRRNPTEGGAKKKKNPAHAHKKAETSIVVRFEFVVGLFSPLLHRHNQVIPI